MVTRGSDLESTASGSKQRKRIQTPVFPASVYLQKRSQSMTGKPEEPFGECLLISNNGYPKQASIALEEVGLSGSGKATRSSNETSSSPVNFSPMLSGPRPLDLEILPDASGVRISSCLSNVSLVRPHILWRPSGTLTF